MTRVSNGWKFFAGFFQTLEVDWSQQIAQTAFPSLNAVNERPSYIIGVFNRKILFPFIFKHLLTVRAPAFRLNAQFNRKNERSSLKRSSWIKMKTKGKIKPSKPVSFIQMIMGGIFAIIGITVVIPQMTRTDGPVWFGLLWTGLAIVGAIVGAINLFSDEGIPTEEFSYTSNPDDKQQSASRYKSVESRLNEIKNLRDKNLISNDEYDAKRSKILNEI